MDIIRLLPEHVANQIAAGEVVQRPASVVKELMENAIDAEATVIKLLIKDAGRTLVQVIDNGKGMSVTDARMCFERHATSKISHTEDLFKLHTKGFRGEALASIAAVAQVELKTKTGYEELGTKINIEGSKILLQEPEVFPDGTSIAVKNLFYNIPARRNFLKADNIELRHIIDEFQRLALSHPHITFFMYHNDTELYHLPVSNLKKRILNIFGAKFNEKLVPIEEQTDWVNLSGFIVKPEFAKKKRGEQFFFVNNRFIRSNYFNHGLKAAFEGLITNEQHPGFFIFIEVPPNTIDINIHPTKTEVKFENENDLYAIIYASVKHALGQYNVAPVLDFNHNQDLDIPYKYHHTLPQKEPQIQVDKNFNPFRTHSKSESWEALYSGLNPEWDNQQPRETLSSNFELPLSQDETKNTLIFQLHHKYIVSSIKSGLVFIHQNRAHQRILFEKFLENISSGNISSQQLLFPIQMDFEKNDIITIKTRVEDLMTFGFTFETIKDNYLIINGIPEIISPENIQSFFEDLLNETFQNNDNTVDFTTDLAKLLAKNSSVRVGQRLSNKEQESLVDDLFQCTEPTLSPFGKLTFTTLTLEEIDKRL